MPCTSYGTPQAPRPPRGPRRSLPSAPDRPRCWHAREAGPRRLPACTHLLVRSRSRHVRIPPAARAPEDTLTVYPAWHGSASTATLLAGTGHSCAIFLARPTARCRDSAGAGVTALPVAGKRRLLPPPPPTVGRVKTGRQHRSLGGYRCGTATHWRAKPTKRLTPSTAWTGQQRSARIASSLTSGGPHRGGCFRGAVTRRGAVAGQWGTARRCRDRPRTPSAACASPPGAWRSHPRAPSPAAGS